MKVFLYSRYNSLLGISSEEILEISQEINQKFTPSIPANPARLASKFSPKELLKISEEISREFSPTCALDVPQLVILPVDPEHLYAYWNVVQDSDPITPTKADEPLTLRIYSESKTHQTHANGIAPTSSSWFDVAVDPPKTQQKVHLPMPNPVGVTYSAQIGRFDADNAFISFADTTHNIHIPRSAVAAKFCPEQPSHSHPIPPFILPICEKLSYLCVMGSNPVNNYK